MALNISDKPYHGHGGENSGQDSLDFTPEQHHVASVDTPTAHDPTGADAAAHETEEKGSHESAQARKGMAWAVEGGSLQGGTPFTTSNGCFTSGDMVGAGFEEAIRSSGGVRQGSTWVSSPAPGARRTVVEHTVTLDQLHKQDEGSGRTFETQRRANWSHDRWGG